MEHTHDVDYHIIRRWVYHDASRAADPLPPPWFDLKRASGLGLGAERYSLPCWAFFITRDSLVALWRRSGPVVG